MNAQISFIEGKFSLIHIPLDLYSSLLKPILRVLLPHGGPTHSHEPEGLLEGLSVDNKHGFLNISVTPIECSIVCHTSWADAIFRPILSSLPKETSKHVSISKENYMIFSVSSAGMEAGQRVMDLTAPLAMAGIPIFFITTYYTDFILVPSKDRKTVGKALLQRGFEFSENDSAYVAPTPAPVHTRLPSSTSVNHASPPSTPPPTNVAELQVRTFAQLKKRHVIPFVEPGLRLVQCSGKEIDPSHTHHSHIHDHNHYHHDDDDDTNSSSTSRSYSSWLDAIDPKLFISLISALIQQPRFLSITLAADDAPSLLLDKSLLWLFGDSITGDTECDLVPIFLDLAGLPAESTGIVCGVAGKLVDETRRDGGDGNGGGSGGEGVLGELSYLSTARAGAVVLSCEGSVRALEALLPLLEKTEE